MYIFIHPILTFVCAKTLSLCYWNYYCNCMKGYKIPHPVWVQWWFKRQHMIYRPLSNVYDEHNINILLNIMFIISDSNLLYWMIFVPVWAKKPSDQNMNKVAFSSRDSFWCCATYGDILVSAETNIMTLLTLSHLCLFTVSSYSFFLLCCWWLNERTGVALPLISCEQVSVWQPQAVEPPCKMCIFQELVEVCRLWAQNTSCLAWYLQEGRELTGCSMPVCVGLTRGRSLGEGLGDGGSRVTWPRCETAVATRCWSLESHCRSDDGPVCVWVCEHIHK